MCQLLGMNCAAPTDFSFSFRGFCRRGGATDIHSHGFGVMVYEGRGLRSFLDTLPAATSPVAELVQRYPIRTYNMMAHVRYATQGCVSLENVHPFSRELWGIHWCFCHNGEVPKFCNWVVQKEPRLGKTTELAYRPIGDTDSEAVFCAILNALKAEFGHALPTLPVLHSFLRKLCDEIIEGHTEDCIFNFLLGCGQYTLFAYSWPGRRPGSKVWNGLHYIVREPPFSTAKLVDDDFSIDFAAVTTPSDRIAVITTKPLTCEEGWTEFKRGELLMFDNGLPYSSAETCEAVERQGRGLYSKCFGKGCPKQMLLSEFATLSLSESKERVRCEQLKLSSIARVEGSPSTTTTADCPFAVEAASVALQAAAVTACLKAEAQQRAKQHTQRQPTTCPTSPVSPVSTNRIVEC